MPEHRTRLALSGLSWLLLASAAGLSLAAADAEGRGGLDALALFAPTGLLLAAAVLGLLARYAR